MHGNMSRCTYFGFVFKFVKFCDAMYDRKFNIKKLDSVLEQLGALKQIGSAK